MYSRMSWEAPSGLMPIGTQHGRGQGLRHPALAQQHHLDALTLLGGYFPPQRCFQPPDLALGAFDHLFPSESDDLSESHFASRRQFTATFGTRYPKHFDSISYGRGMRGARAVGRLALS